MWQMSKLGEQLQKLNEKVTSLSASLGLGEAMEVHLSPRSLIRIESEVQLFKSNLLDLKQRISDICLILSEYSSTTFIPRCECSAQGQRRVPQERMELFQPQFVRCFELQSEVDMLLDLLANVNHRVSCTLRINTSNEMTSSLAAESLVLKTLESQLTDLNQQIMESNRNVDAFCCTFESAVPGPATDLVLSPRTLACMEYRLQSLKSRLACLKSHINEIRSVCSQRQSMPMAGSESESTAQAKTRADQERRMQRCFLRCYEQERSADSQLSVLVKFDEALSHTQRVYTNDKMTVLLTAERTVLETIESQLIGLQQQIMDESQGNVNAFCSRFESVVPGPATELALSPRSLARMESELMCLKSRLARLKSHISEIRSVCSQRAMQSTPMAGSELESGAQAKTRADQEGRMQRCFLRCFELERSADSQLSNLVKFYVALSLTQSLRDAETIKVGMCLSLLGDGLAVAGVVGSIFGMNLPSGLENSKDAFGVTTGCLVLFLFVLFVIAYMCMKARKLM